MNLHLSQSTVKASGPPAGVAKDRSMYAVSFLLEWDANRSTCGHPNLATKDWKWRGSSARSTAQGSGRDKASAHRFLAPDI